MQHSADTPHASTPAAIATAADRLAPKRPTATTSPRFAGRFYSRERLTALLAEPERSTPWRVEGFVADGTLTLLAAESGKGKSWVAQRMCVAVGEGNTVAGLSCAPGRALYVDGEMGWVMFTNDRLRPTGVTSPSFEYVDASGLDVSSGVDRSWLTDVIRDVGANLVVFDSLRRLTPGKAENDSDHMAPVLGDLAKLARDTRAAIVVIHHKGDGEKPFRGSTAIRDQADALYLLTETQGSDVLRLTCRDPGCKAPRYAAAPPDVFVTIDPAAGGVREAGAPPPNSSKPAAGIRDAMKMAIVKALPAPSKAAAAARCNTSTDHGTFRTAWRELEQAGLIAPTASPGGWQAVPNMGGDTACQPESEPLT